jgi:hypothetical protein
VLVKSEALKSFCVKAPPPPAPPPSTTPVDPSAPPPPAPIQVTKTTLALSGFVHVPFEVKT